MDHDSFSPDLASDDFNLFPTLKEENSFITRTVWECLYKTVKKTDEHY
jgi:hypothetical protein